MSNILFISEAKLKSVTAIHENVTPDDLMPFVLMSQDIYAQDILGTKFYNHLKDAVLNSTLTTAEETLIDDYLSPMLANYTLYLALPTLNYKIKDKSVLNPSSEEALNTGLEEIKYLRQATQDVAQFYSERTIDYLKANDHEFPDYVNPDSDYMLPNKRSQYSHGIFIPRGRGCTNYGEDTEVNLN